MKSLQAFKERWTFSADLKSVGGFIETEIKEALFSDLTAFANVRQIDDYKFNFYRKDKEEIEEWLANTNHVHIVTIFTYYSTVTFEDKRGSVEFKLRFV